MMTENQLADALAKSPIYRDYETAFHQATGQPLALRPVETWQLPHHGQKSENPFCAMMASRSRSCSACLQVQQQLAECAKDCAASVTCPAGMTDTAINAPTLEGLVQQGWQDHAKDAAGVLARLPGAIALVQTPAHAMSLAGLVVHVAGEHLGLWDEGIRLVERIRGLALADAPAEASLCRSLAILHLCRGDEAAAPRVGRAEDSEPGRHGHRCYRRLPVDGGEDDARGDRKRAEDDGDRDRPLHGPGDVDDDDALVGLDPPPVEPSVDELGRPERRAVDRGRPALTGEPGHGLIVDPDGEAVADHRQTGSGGVARVRLGLASHERHADREEGDERRGPPSAPRPSASRSHLLSPTPPTADLRHLRPMKPARPLYRHHGTRQ